MGVQIFLGKPPANIEQWIKDHHGPEPGPTAPDGKVLYKTEAGGEWLQDDADISDGAFNGFANKDSAVEVIIPSKDASGNDVTSIGSGAFAECTSLTDVTIPDGVTGIGDGAFYACSGLTSLTIGNGVTNIGYSAFSFCSSLTNVTIGTGLMNIPGYAFDGCRGLTSVTFNSFTKNEVKSMTTNDYLFGTGFHDDE